MAKLLDRMRVLFGNRRKRDDPRDDDRRGGGGMRRFKEAAEKERDAQDELNRTVRMRRDDLLKKFGSNDHQQVVIFSTFQEICRFNLPMGDVRICRHPKHKDAANSDLAICDEKNCPLIGPAAA